MRNGITRLVGPLMMLTAVGHAVVGAILFSEPLSAIVREGVVNSIQPPMYSADPHFDRIAAFWFLLFSPVLFLLGQVVNRGGWYLIGNGGAVARS